MSAMGIICSPGLTHIIGPSSLSVGLCSLRLEKVPQGNVRCVTTVTHFTLTELLSIAAHADKTHTHTDLQKGRFREHAEELWEVVSDLLIHGTDQADLTHGASAVGSLGIRPLHLREGTER